MIFGSCHFLCHQFTQGNKPDQIIADMDALAAFSATFVRSPDIDCLYQLMGRVRRQFRQFCVLSDLLSQLLRLTEVGACSCQAVLRLSPPAFYHPEFRAWRCIVGRLTGRPGSVQTC